MYHTIDEFLNEWKVESESTSKIFKNISDESLNLPIPNYRRTIGRMSWHITGAIGEMMKTAGFPIEAVEDSLPQPECAGEIVQKYQQASDNFVKKLVSDWTDESLKEEVNMYGQMWTKEFVLRCLTIHQIHHRAQLTVLMRIAGLKVPGVYGPSYDEWAHYGMEAQN